MKIKSKRGNEVAGIPIWLFVAIIFLVIAIIIIVTAKGWGVDLLARIGIILRIV